MDFDKYDITVETMFSGGVNKNLLNPRVHYFCKKAFTIKGISYIYKFLPARYLFSKFIGKKEYDLIIAYMHNLPIKVISGCKSDKTKLIGWCHCGKVNKSTYCTCWFTKKGAYKSYIRCDALVGVSEKVVEEIKNFFSPKANCYPINNTNDTDMIRRLSKQEINIEINKNYVSICAVGRLSNEKGNDRLIEATKKLAEGGYKFNVYLLGDGSEKNALKKQVEENGLADTVHFLGFQENPYAIMNNCDVFICPSREEGMSTVTVESIILNKPVISTDVSGATEVLGSNNEYGVVVDNSVDGIYNGIKMFLDDPSLIDHYQIQAKKRAEEYETRKTVSKTEEFFDSFLQ